MRSSSRLLVACVASLLSAACSSDHQTETTTTTTTADTTMTVAAPTVDTTRYRTDADRLAARIAQDLRLTDTVIVTRVRTAYYTRGRRLAEAETRYATDTTGRYAALRAANDEADRAIRTIVTDKDQYRTYETHRGDYYVGTPYTLLAVGEPSGHVTRRGVAITKMEREKDGDVKIKYADGSKVKIEADGDRKVKRADDVKIKTDEDGRKVKR